MKTTFFVKVIIQKSLFFDQKIQRIKLFIFLKFLEKKRKLFYIIKYRKYYHFIDQEQSKKKYDEGRWYINEYY